MAIEKAIYPMDQMEDDSEKPLPLNVTGASVTPLEDGGVEIDFDEEDTEEAEFAALMEAGDHYTNLAEWIADTVEGGEALLEEIGSELCEMVEEDDSSRSEWLRIMNEGIKELGLETNDEDVPFPGACSATHPLMIEAVTKSQAKAFAELYPSKGPADVKILGFENEALIQQATRVKMFTNYEVQHLMPEYGPDLDRGLFKVSFMGSCFRKTWYDHVLRRPSCRFVRPQDFIIDYWATDLETAERYTHRFPMTPNELRKQQVAGFYRDIDLGDSGDAETTEIEDTINRIEGKSKPGGQDAPFEIYEIHTNYDLPGELGDQDGIALPYIITIEKGTQTVLSIRRNWAEGDQSKQKLMHFSHWGFIPGLGFYCYGYLHLIGSLAKTATATLRQLVDAGTFATLPAGFKAHGLRVSGDGSPLSPGEFRDVHAPAMDLTKSLIPLPFKEPSQVVYALLEFMVRSGEKFVDSTEQLLSEAKNYGPVGTTMALLEQGGKLYTAVHKRLHAAQATDFKILSRINGEWLPEQYPFRVHGNAQNVLRRDFDGRVDVVPVSDPNMPSQSHRIAHAQAIFAIASQAPQLHDMRKILRRQYEAMGEENPDEYLLPPPQDAMPADPITENVNIMNTKPVKAGVAQNHIAHIKAHFAFLQMPNVQQNQMALQAGMAHVHEHVALEYRLRIEKILGGPLPQGNQQLPPEVEEQIAIAAAQATESLLQEDIMKQVMSDPTAYVAMQGLEVEREKNKVRAQIDAAKLGKDLEQMERDDMNEDMDRWVDIKKLNLDITKAENDVKMHAQEMKAKPKGESK